MLENERQMPWLNIWIVWHSLPDFVCDQETTVVWDPKSTLVACTVHIYLCVSTIHILSGTSGL